MHIAVKEKPKPTSGIAQESLKLRLLLSAFQMAEEGYPMRLDLPGLPELYKEFVFTNDSYEEVSEDSPMFSVDCEMCLTTSGRNELTRIREVTE